MSASRACASSQAERASRSMSRSEKRARSRAARLRKSHPAPTARPSEMMTSVISRGVIETVYRRDLFRLIRRRDDDADSVGFGVVPGHGRADLLRVDGAVGRRFIRYERSARRIDQCLASASVSAAAAASCVCAMATSYSPGPPAAKYESSRSINSAT